MFTNGNSGGCWVLAGLGCPAEGVVFAIAVMVVLLVGVDTDDVDGKLRFMMFVSISVFSRGSVNCVVR